MNNHIGAPSSKGQTGRGEVTAVCACVSCVCAQCVPGHAGRCWEMSVSACVSRITICSKAVFRKQLLSKPGGVVCALQEGAGEKMEEATKAPIALDQEVIMYPHNRSSELLPLFLVVRCDTVPESPDCCLSLLTAFVFFSIHHP